MAAPDQHRDVAAGFNHVSHPNVIIVVRRQRLARLRLLEPGLHISKDALEPFHVFIVWFYMCVDIVIGLIDLCADVGMCFVEDPSVSIVDLWILLELKGACDGRS